MKYYKNVKTGNIHSYQTWIGLAFIATKNLEVETDTLTYLNEKIKSGFLIEVPEASDDDIKRANYKILYIAKLLGFHYGIDSECEIYEMNLKIYPIGKVPVETLNGFKKKLEEYKNKVYSEYGFN